MSENKRPKPIVHVAHSVYIDPIHCDSTVSYKVVEQGLEDKRYASGEVKLSDCTRTISWYFGDGEHEESLAKINRAIDALKAFRVALRHAQLKVKRQQRLATKSGEQ